MARGALDGNVERVGGSFSIKGNVRGLYPGGRVPLALSIANPNRRAIEVTSVVVRVSNDPSRPGCVASEVVRATSFRGALKIAPGSRKKLTLRISLLSQASDACQGAVFPLRYVGKAVAP